MHHLYHFRRSLNLCVEFEGSVWREASAYSSARYAEASTTLTFSEPRSPDTSLVRLDGTAYEGILSSYPSRSVCVATRDVSAEELHPLSDMVLLWGFVSRVGGGEGRYAGPSPYVLSYLC